MTDELKSLARDIMLVYLEQDVAELTPDWDAEKRWRDLDRFLGLARVRARHERVWHKIDNLRSSVDLRFVSQTAEQYVFFVWIHFRCRVPKEGL